GGEGGGGGWGGGGVGAKEAAPGSLALAAFCPRRVVQRRGPALAFARELACLFGRELRARRFEEELGFLGRQREVIHADLEELSAGTQLRERQVRRGAAGEREHGPSGKVLGERVDCFDR